MNAALELTVPLSVHAPGQARHALERYEPTIEEGLLNDLKLLTGELVTNAVQHSGCPEGDPIGITADFGYDRVRVEVVDRGDGVDVLRARSDLPPSGVQLLELMSDRWSSAIGHSFHVWFEIDTHDNAMLHRPHPVGQ
jgi:anti-sigma regulatory factor (Ser/Thr protein kinase)